MGAVCSLPFLRALLLRGSLETVVFSTASELGALVAALTRAVRVARAAGQPTSDAGRPQMPKSGLVALEVDTALRLSDQFSPSPNSYP